MRYYGKMLGQAIAQLLLVNTVVRAEIRPSRGLTEVDHSRVELKSGFWGPRLKTHVEVTIPHALNCLEADGHVTNFDKAAGVTNGLPAGHQAFDSDLHKALEGAMYTFTHMEDTALFKRVDGIIDRILAAQQDDGFLISYFMLKEQQYRWDQLRTAHQMYNAGHYFEMAVEHQKLTGDPKVLNSAKRFADHIDGIFGPNKRYDADGHQEIELALVKLYRATGERRYVELSKFFLDERGYQHGMERKPYDPSTPVIAPEYEKDLPDRAKRNRARARKRDGRAQDHKPVVEQMEAVGHAVRAGYMYAAMTDIVRFMKAPGYERALDSLWDDIVGRKMYVDGGVGTAQYGAEDFGDPYLLPNKTYCETCANVAHVFWQYRMNLLKEQSKYADVMELALYNGVLSGISLSGNEFNYRNELTISGKSRRSWIGLSCCPSNMSRLIPQVGGFIYARGKSRLYVNLFAAGTASLKLDDGTKLELIQETNYPWDGNVRLTVTPDNESRFTLCLRIPAWALGRPVPSDLYRFVDSKVPPVGLKINGEAAKAKAKRDGYVHLKRKWKAGDVVELDFPMPVHRVYAHEKVKEDVGKVALMRGPIVYCFEAPDYPDTDVFKSNKSRNSLFLPKDATIKAEYRAELLGGATVLTGQALSDGEDGQRPVNMMAIPRYAWGNRSKEKQAFTVWVDER
ncbi:MAG: glycoside hydrolase family 127 protein [Kiritimatiellia bacterium]|nr:glycoside hydrolase family 127 protein [Kiritimatiellia bacterium]